MAKALKCDKCGTLSCCAIGWRKVLVRNPVPREYEYPECDEELDICQLCWDNEVVYALHAQ